MGGGGGNQGVRFREVEQHWFCSWAGRTKSLINYLHSHVPRVRSGLRIVLGVKGRLINRSGIGFCNGTLVNSSQKALKIALLCSSLALTDQAKVDSIEL